MAKKAATKANGRPRNPPAAWNFPKSTLEDALAIPKAIEEKNAGKPLDSATLAKYVGFNQPKDWRYLDLLRSANMYGLVSGSGAAAEVTLADIGESIVAPSSPDQRKKALGAAFNNIDIFQNVAEFYAGKKIPEDEYFANTLTREFEVERERIEHFIKVFSENLAYLRSFGITPSGESVPLTDDPESDTSVDVDKKPPTRRREFLDTCFVLMPFGGWYDRYYEEIYRPAIKDAGFEPFRADDLFHTGSVMEQIWDQVQRSKVLLAELTGKNANVFYELGLAHAIGKPVVFVTGHLDDVPFDLRHLRVIPYEVQAPGWSDRLRHDISTYLKNTRSDPAKSIPQPYRDHYSARMETYAEEQVKIDLDNEE